MRGVLVLITVSALIVTLLGAQAAALAVVLRIEGTRNLALLGAAHAAVAAALLVGLAWHLHFLNRERRRQAIIEALIDALSGPASIGATAEATLAVLVGSGVARAGLVAVLNTDEDDRRTLTPVAAIGARRGWTGETIEADARSSVAGTRRERVTDDPWLLGFEGLIGRHPWVMRLPIERGDEQLGALVLSAKRRGWLGDRVLTRTASTTLAAALDHGRQYQFAYERTRDLEEQNARRREFLYAIAHELRSPLTSIQAFAELLTSDRSLMESDSDLLLSSLSRGVDRLAAFVNDLLDLGRVEDATLAMHVGPMDVTEALRGAETILRPAFMARDQALTLETPDTAVRAIGDERALEQVILNLLSNANRFTPTRGAVTVRVTDRDGRVRIEVQDSGPGIDVRDRQQVFDPFYRVHRAGAPEVPGSGLGLAVARRLTETMGGRIWVDPVEGGPGSVFCVELLGADLDAPA
ncbi:MAG: HAMP domain-containing sensor histidine kinase [Dehalococcoidia bacterium]